MINFESRKSFAGFLEPGDCTRYHMVVVEDFGCYHVVVLNDEFFDKITFIIGQSEPYYTFRQEKTNPWTIKAAKIMLDKYLEVQNAERTW